MIENNQFSPVEPDANESDSAGQVDSAEQVEQLDSAAAAPTAEQTPNVNQFAHRFDLLFSSKSWLEPYQRLEQQRQLLKEVESAEEKLYQQPGFSESTQADQLAALRLQLRQELVNQATTPEQLIETVAVFSSISVVGDEISGVEYADVLRKRLHLFRGPGFNDPDDDVWLFITRNYGLRQKMKDLILKEV